MTLQGVIGGIPGTKNLSSISTGSLKHCRRQNLLFPESLVHCSQGNPGEQGEHWKRIGQRYKFIYGQEFFPRTLILERWHAQQAPACLTSRASRFSLSVNGLTRPLVTLPFWRSGNALKTCEWWPTSGGEGEGGGCEPCECGEWCDTGEPCEGVYKVLE
jgi:hypothetical protein